MLIWTRYRNQLSKYGIQPTSSDDVPCLQLYSQMDFTLIKFYLVPYAPLRLYLAVNRERVQISKTLYVFICAIVTRHWSWFVMDIQVINCKTVPHEGDITTRKSNSQTIFMEMKPHKFVFVCIFIVWSSLDWITAWDDIDTP